MRKLVLPLAGLALAGCGGGEARFSQTWSQDYRQTDCREWRHDMTPEHRFIAAADLLVYNRNGDDKNSSMPSDDLISRFEAKIGEVCTRDSTVLAVHPVAESIYRSFHDIYRP